MAARARPACARGRRGASQRSAQRHRLRRHAGRDAGGFAAEPRRKLSRLSEIHHDDRDGRRTRCRTRTCSRSNITSSPIRRRRIRRQACSSARRRAICSRRRPRRRPKSLCWRASSRWRSRFSMARIGRIRGRYRRPRRLPEAVRVRMHPARQGGEDFAPPPIEVLVPWPTDLTTPAASHDVRNFGDGRNSMISDLRAKKRASVLIVVLWASVGLVSVALLFGHSMLMAYSRRGQRSRRAAGGPGDRRRGALRGVAARESDDAGPAAGSGELSRRSGAGRRGGSSGFSAHPQTRPPARRASMVSSMRRRN